MIRIFSFLCLFLLAASPSAAVQPQAAAIDALFFEWDTARSPGAAVAVVHGDTIVYQRGYGMANLEYEVPITPSTIFLVASVSKQFTAYAIARLAADGMLSLDDSVQKYIPELHDFGEVITIRHLVHHTSGLRDEFSLLAMAGYHMDDVITKESILNLLYRQRKLNFSPGEEYSYSNSGYTLMAEIVARVTGESFANWTQKNIFEPIGMQNSHFRDNHRHILKNRSHGYVTIPDGYKKQVIPYASVGASGLYTTVQDLALWTLNFQKEDGIGGKAVMELMHEQGTLNNGDTLAYAFGQNVGSYKGRRRIGHSGSHRGFRTHLIRLPDDNLAVIVLSNLEEFNPAEMAQKVLDLYLTEDLSAYTGFYYSEELQTTYTITLSDTRLVAKHRRYDDIQLTHSDTDTFLGDSWFLASLTFTREMGRITGFEVSNSRTRKVQFTKQ